MTNLKTLFPELGENQLKALYRIILEEVVGEDYPSYIHNIKSFQATQRTRLNQLFNKDNL